MLDRLKHKRFYMAEGETCCNLPTYINNQINNLLFSLSLPERKLCKKNRKKY